MLGFRNSLKLRESFKWRSSKIWPICIIMSMTTAFKWQGYVLKNQEIINLRCFICPVGRQGNVFCLFLSSCIYIYIYIWETNIYSCLFFIYRVKSSNFVSLRVNQGTHRFTSDNITCLFWQRQQLSNFVNTFWPLVSQFFLKKRKREREVEQKL